MRSPLLAAVLAGGLAAIASAHDGALVPDAWYLGEVQEGSSGEIRAVLSSAQPARIVRVRPSCDCLRAEVAPVVEGERPLEFVVRFVARGLSVGLHDEAVFVHWDAGGEEHVARFTVRFRVRGADRPGEVLLFVSREAGDGADLLARVETFREETGLPVEVLELEDLESYKRLRRLERTAGLTELADVELFVDGAPSAGRGAILRKLDELAARHRVAPEGSVVPAAPPEALPIRLFASAGCGECRRIRQGVIAPLLARWPDQLRLEEFDVRKQSEYAELLAAERRAGRMATGAVTVEVGEGHLLSGAGEIEADLERLTRDLLEGREVRGPTDPEEAVRQRFLGFAFGSIVLAGLVDGLNPCAFVTAVLLLSMLQASGASRRQVFRVGAAFVLATWFTYLAIGAGLQALIDRLQTVDWLAPIVVRGTAVAALLLAALSARDLVRYARTGRARDVAVQLPGPAKRAIHRILRGRTGAGAKIAGAATAAVLVTLIEAGCTGQVYFPTLLLVARHPDLRTRAWGCLVAYCAAFVVPLVAVWLLAWKGVASERLQAWSRRNVILAKGAMAAVFLALAAGLLVLGP